MPDIGRTGLLFHAAAGPEYEPPIRFAPDTEAVICLKSAILSILRTQGTLFPLKSTRIRIFCPNNGCCVRKNKKRPYFRRIADALSVRTVTASVPVTPSLFLSPRHYWEIVLRSQGSVDSDVQVVPLHGITEDVMPDGQLQCLQRQFAQLRNVHDNGGQLLA